MPGEAGPPRVSLVNRTWARRAALWVVAAVAGLSYAWELNRDPLEPYYAAAVRSMSMSWHNFVYGAFDPAGTVTLDKLPGAFWIQALFVRVLGVHTWVIVLPQVIEGVITVLFLYRAVQRLAGPTAGLIAAAIMAVSPATVALNRGNISDSLMILLVVAAADAVSSAVERASLPKLILAAVWVGLAFQAKMVEAWVLVPALGLTYLVSAPGLVWQRVRQLVVAALVVGVVSLSWMTAVSLVPGSDRPYVDGSHHDSVYQQVFVYNGFGRFGSQTPLQLLAGQSLGIGVPAPAPPAAANRLLRGDLGRDTGWLLPAAAVIALWGVASRWRRPRGDPLKAGFVLWGAWLATLVVTFSVTSAINSYYAAALTPAIAALIGIGVANLWSGTRPTMKRRLCSAIVVAGTVAYAAWLVPASGPGVPQWLVPVVIVAGTVAVGWMLASTVLASTVLASTALRSDKVVAMAVAAGVAACCLAPAVASAGVAVKHEGAFDTPFEPASEKAAIDYVFLTTPDQVKGTIAELRSVQNGAPYLLATQTSALASVFIYASGLEALPIGGFTGTIPSPTLAQLQADIRQGRFHLVLAGNSRDARVRWIATHCRNVGNATASLHNYYCSPSDG